MYITTKLRTTTTIKINKFYIIPIRAIKRKFDKRFDGVFDGIFNYQLLV